MLPSHAIRPTCPRQSGCECPVCQLQVPQFDKWADDAAQALLHLARFTTQVQSDQLSQSPDGIVAKGVEHITTYPADTTHCCDVSNSSRSFVIVLAAKYC